MPLLEVGLGLVEGDRHHLALVGSVRSISYPTAGTRLRRPGLGPLLNPGDVLPDLIRVASLECRNPGVHTLPFRRWPACTGESIRATALERECAGPVAAAASTPSHRGEWKATMADLRVSSTLSGGASLGAFQAGAVAALLVGFRHARLEEDSDVRVDAIGGASAGSLVGLLTAFSLLEGADGPKLLSRAWVEEVDLAMLEEGDAEGPLSLDGVQERFPGMLDDAETDPEKAQEGPLTMIVQLTGLRGLTYEIPGVRHDRPAEASTFADWKRFELDRRGGVEQIVEPQGTAPLDFVIASASHPGAFPPQLLDRSADRADYEKQGIVDFPTEGKLWYTDGGLVQSEPLGRVIAAAHEREQDDPAATHLNLVIDARSEEPDGASRWGEADADVGWVQALARALSIFPAQGLYEDMRRVERDNRRMARIDELVEAIGPRLDEDTAKALVEVLDRTERDRAEAGGAGRGDGEDDGSADPGEALRRALEAVAGVEGKRHVEIDLISPLVMANETGESVPELLAGEHLGDFSGFLDEDLRRSDFALGYECSLTWAKGGLGNFDLDPAWSTARSRRSRRDASTTGTRSAAARRASSDLPAPLAVCGWRGWRVGRSGR